MNHTAPIHEPAIRPIALDRLFIADENVRRTPPDAGAEAELKASIAAHGLLENLVVRSDGPDGGYAVVAGGRRLAALQALAADGVLDFTHPVPCLVVDGNAPSSELSLAENVVRIAMHPADQVVAFTKLAESGVSVPAIAARSASPSAWSNSAFGSATLLPNCSTPTATTGSTWRPSRPSPSPPTTAARRRSGRRWPTRATDRPPGR